MLIPLRCIIKYLTFYYASRGGVDSVDQICSTFNCAWNSQKWPMVNVTEINDCIVYHENKY